MLEYPGIAQGYFPLVHFKLDFLGRIKRVITLYVIFKGIHEGKVQLVLAFKRPGKTKGYVLLNCSWCQDIEHY